MSLLSLKDVSYRYEGAKRDVFDNINIDFEKGKVYGITGRNGSGKTVFLKILCGLLPPNQGTVRVNGKTIGKDIDFPESVGAIIESPGFLPYWSGYKNLSYLASLRNRIGAAEISDAMKLVGLDPKDKKPVGKYSLGMKQRLGIAQAIMENPQLLILDEPMNGLDADSVSHMRILLKDMRNSGKTIIMASHMQEDLAVLCDELYELNEGCLHLKTLKTLHDC